MSNNSDQNPICKDPDRPVSPENISSQQIQEITEKYETERKQSQEIISKLQLGKFMISLHD